MGIARLLAAVGLGVAMMAMGAHAQTMASQTMDSSAMASPAMASPAMASPAMAAQTTTSPAKAAQTTTSQTAAPSIAGTAAADPVLDEAAQQIGLALFLRCLCAGKNLSFDASGRLADGVKSTPVDWTLAGIDVKKVVRHGPETVELDGERAAVSWNEDLHEFRRRELKNEPVHVVIAGDADAASTEKTLDAVFSVGIDRAFQLSTPPYWRHYFFPKMPWPKDSLDGVTIFTAGGTVNGVVVDAPVLKKKVKADYVPEAAHDRVRGPVVMEITVDATGKPQRIAIVQPLGYGLDAAAVRAEEKGVYAPPMVDGKAVAMMFRVRDNFTVQTPPTQ